VQIGWGATCSWRLNVGEVVGGVLQGCSELWAGWFRLC
jgi:hypothetical protein